MYVFSTYLRYKNLLTALVLQAFTRMIYTVGVECMREVRYDFSKVENIALYSILLNCGKNFSGKEVKAFHGFIQLLYGEKCYQVKVSKQGALDFYNKAIKLLEYKMEGERLAYSNNLSFLPAPGRRARKDIVEQAIGDDKKSQKQKLQQVIVNLYIKCQKVSDTKQRFEKVHGFHEQYAQPREIQAVIFKFCRKTIRDIEDYCRRYFQMLPQLSAMNDYKIKQVLTSSKGLTIRIKLLLLNQAFGKKEKILIINGNQISVNSWQVEFTQLNEVDQVLLVDLVKEINKFFQGTDACEIQLFDGKPPNFKMERKRRDFRTDDQMSLPSEPRRQRRRGIFDNNFTHGSSRQQSLASNQFFE